MIEQTLSSNQFRQKRLLTFTEIAFFMKFLLSKTFVMPKKMICCSFFHIQHCRDLKGSHQHFN